MVVAFLRVFALTAALLATGASAQSLALPDSLIDLRSPQGETLLFDAKAHAAYLPISAAFETQKNQAFCGVASMVMTLNAIHAPAPPTPEYQPYSMFTQDNVLDETTEAILPRAVLMRQGMTLDQLGALLRLHPVTAEVHHAGDGSLDEFRATASRYLGETGHFVVVNYLRRVLGQERGGHISPLAAYDEKADRFLILDVARYKYPPVWVATADLFNAMNTPDSDNDNRTRGYVLVAARTRAEASPAH